MFFNNVPEARPDAVFGLAGAFKADVRREKVDLMVGIYRDDRGKTVLFPSVARAKGVIEDGLADYLPIDGMGEFCEGVGRLLFGEGVWGAEHGRIYGAQTVGGTAALRVGAEFLAREVTGSICIPDPTWANHRQVFEGAGCRVESYPYYDRGRRGFDCGAMCERLGGLPEKTVVLLHGSCHNPTGRDPSLEEWGRIADVMRERRLLPFFDCAYQGLGEGLERDAGAVRLFMERGHEMVVAYSCSKNFSLYCQRVGALFVVDENPAVKLRVGSQVRRIIRTLYSNPPAHGARIVVEILKNGRKGWEGDLEGVRRRIVGIREALIDRLVAGARGTDFGYLRGHQGLFMYVDLTRGQVQRLIDECAVYLLDSGRMSVAGLTPGNVDYVADSLLKVVES